MERVEEHKRWEEGGECLWETQEEREACEIWRRERMGAARTRGRTVGDINGGWWGEKRWRGMYGVGGGGTGAIHKGRKRERGQSQSDIQSSEEEEDDSGGGGKE